MSDENQRKDDAMTRCKTCGEDSKQMSGEMCSHCHRKKEFADFAEECELTRFVDPTGERYVYCVDGSLAGKKVEETDFMDELWNALAKAKGRSDLVVNC